MQSGERGGDKRQGKGLKYRGGSQWEGQDGGGRESMSRRGGGGGRYASQPEKILKRAIRGEKEEKTQRGRMRKIQNLGEFFSG